MQQAPWARGPGLPLSRGSRRQFREKGGRRAEPGVLGPSCPRGAPTLHISSHVLAWTSLKPLTPALVPSGTNVAAAPASEVKGRSSASRGLSWAEADLSHTEGRRGAAAAAQGGRGGLRPLRPLAGQRRGAVLPARPPHDAERRGCPRLAQSSSSPRDGLSIRPESHTKLHKVKSGAFNTQNLLQNSRENACGPGPGVHREGPSCSRGCHGAERRGGRGRGVQGLTAAHALTPTLACGGSGPRHLPSRCKAWPAARHRRWGPKHLELSRGDGRAPSK